MFKRNVSSIATFPDSAPRILTTTLIGAFVLCLNLTGQVRADDFAAVRYDRKNNKLVVTLNYQGTNPHHHFTIKWGECQANQDGSMPGAAAEILDDQFNDAAQQNYTKTVRFSLDDMPCPRPMSLTLRSAPRFFYTLTIPK